MKNPTFKRFTTNHYRGKDCQKRGVEQFANLRRKLARKRGVVILKGVVNTPMHTMMMLDLITFFNFSLILFKGSVKI